MISKELGDMITNLRQAGFEEGRNYKMPGFDQMKANADKLERTLIEKVQALEARVPLNVSGQDHKPVILTEAIPR